MKLSLRKSRKLDEFERKKKMIKTKNNQTFLAQLNKLNKEQLSKLLTKFELAVSVAEDSRMFRQKAIELIYSQREIHEVYLPKFLLDYIPYTEQQKKHFELYGIHALNPYEELVKAIIEVDPVLVIANCDLLDLQSIAPFYDSDFSEFTVTESRLALLQHWSYQNKEYPEFVLQFLANRYNISLEGESLSDKNSSFYERLSETLDVLEEEPVEERRAWTDSDEIIEDDSEDTDNTDESIDLYTDINNWLQQGKALCSKLGDNLELSLRYEGGELSFKVRGILS